QAELAGIRRAQRAAEAGMSAARDLLRAAERQNGNLVLDGKPLTCERLKVAVEQAFTANGAFADEFIVSHGAQTAVGHEMGSGPISPDEPVCLDLFPRDRESGCFADMTRVFVVGEPSEELAEYHRLCREALEAAVAAVKPGIAGSELNRISSKVFEEHGYPTLLSKQPGEVLKDGFYHSLGHGVGLEVHEDPALGRGPGELVAGDVIAVEAGLGDKVAYYWEGEPEDERRTITFADLQRDVVRFANALKEFGVRKGTPVAIYMGMIPELPIAMLACARLGAPHTVVFGGFSAEALSSRMNDMACEVLITQSEGLRGGKRVPLK